MRAYFVNENGYVEQESWTPHCWVNVECPDKDDIRFMLDDLKVPSEFIESIEDDDERPRIDHEGDWRLTIVRIPRRNESKDMPYSTVPIGIITNNEIFLTLCFHLTEVVGDFISHTRCRGITVETEADFILRILNSSAYWYLKYLKNMNNGVIRDSKSLEKSIRNEDLFSLLGIQRTLVYFNTSVQGNETLIGRMRRVFSQNYDTDLLEDVAIELHQADNTVNIYSHILESTMDSFSSVISNNVNSIMKKMTAVSIVLMVPTLIASFYGMNVRVYLDNNPYAFWMIIAFSMVLSSLLYLILRKIHWF